MYDPEFDLIFKDQMIFLYDSMNTNSVNNFRQLFGKDSMLVGLFDSFYNVIEKIKQRKSDYDNCFDKQDCDKIKIEIQNMIKDVMLFWNDFKRIFKI